MGSPTEAPAEGSSSAVAAGDSLALGESTDLAGVRTRREGDGDQIVGHTRTQTEAGPDFCAECSDEINDWVVWPCDPVLAMDPDPIDAIEIVDLDPISADEPINADAIIEALPEDVELTGLAEDGSDD